jgi:hypothetical protein
MPIPTKPIDPAMRSWAEQQVKAARETLRCAVDEHNLWQKRCQQVYKGRPAVKLVVMFEEWRLKEKRR